MAARIGEQPHTKTYFVFINIGERKIQIYSLLPVMLLGFQHLAAQNILKKLAGVKGNPCADGDDVAPALLPKSTKEEIEKKEIKALDRIIEELKYVYLKDFAYDDFPVHVENIEFQANMQEKYSLKKLASFFKAPVSQAVRDNYKDVMTDFRDLLKHIDRRKCKITFIKCQQCKPCLNTKVKSQKVNKFVHIIFIILKHI